MLWYRVYMNVYRWPPCRQPTIANKPTTLAPLSVRTRFGAEGGGSGSLALGAEGGGAVAPGEESWRGRGSRWRWGLWTPPNPSPSSRLPPRGGIPGKPNPCGLGPRRDIEVATRIFDTWPSGHKALVRTVNSPSDLGYRSRRYCSAKAQGYQIC